MSTRQGYYNRDVGKWVDSAGTSQYTEASEPYVTRRELLTFELNVMKTDDTGATVPYTGWADGGTYTYRFFVDNDYVNYIVGELETAITAGAISEIKVDNVNTTNGSPLSTGNIVLTNTSGNSESFAYTAYTLAAGVYTFTVSATALYSYALNDSAKVVEPSLIEVENADIDQTDKDTGILIVTMDANNQAFTNAADAAASAEISSCLFEVQVLDGSGSIVDTITGNFRCLNLLVDDFANPPSAPTTNYYNKAQSDARYQYKDGDAVLNNIAIFDAAGNSVDSGIDIQSLVNSLEPQGNWDANTNDPDISGTTETGYFWIVSVAGSTSLGGITDWQIGDWAVKTAAGWAKVDNSETGKVLASATDPTAGFLNAKVDDATIGVTSDQLYVKSLGIDTAQLAADAVETAKILDANVTLDKLASGSVNYLKHVVASDQTLTDNSTASINLVTAVTYQCVKMHLSVKADSASDYMQADVIIVHDGTNANVNTVEIYQPSAGNSLNGPLTFTADINSGSLRLQATLTSLGGNASMKYKILDAIEAI